MWPQVGFGRWAKPITQSREHCAPRPRGEWVRASIREGKLRESGTVLGKDVLRGVLEELLGECPTLPLLMVRVKARGLEMRFHEFEDGKGVSFGVEDRFFQGRQLGGRFTFGGLQEFAGVDYEPERDDPVLRQLNQMSAEVCRAMVSQMEQSQPGQGEAERLLEWQRWVGQQEQDRQEAEREAEEKRRC